MAIEKEPTTLLARDMGEARYMLLEILRWNFRPKSTRLPLYLIVFVTYRCNSRCRTCFYHEKLNLPESSDLPLEFYEKIARSLDHLTWLHLSGGEPFLRQDLPELVAAFYRSTGVRRIGIPTNALLAKRVVESTRRILSLCPDAQLNIVLSLDGFEETHDYIRGVPGNWKKTMETLGALKTVQAEYPQLCLNICTVLNDRNAPEIPELLRFVRNLGVDFHDIGLMRGDYPDERLKLPPVEEIANIMTLVAENARHYYAENRHYPASSARRAARVHRYLNQTFLRFLSVGATSQPCFAGDGFAVIEPNGDVKLCELTPVVGNLLDFDGDFEAFWKSEAVRSARCKGVCPEGSCTHSNFQTRNFILNPLQWWRALP